MDIFVAAAAAVLGAVVGALASWGTTRANLRAEEQRADRQQVLAASAVQRDACLSYLAAAFRFSELLREQVALLEDDRLPTRETSEAYEEAWTDLTSSRSAVRLLCPEDLAAAAEQLRRDLGTLSDEVEASRGKSVVSEQARQLMERAGATLNGFVIEARRHYASTG